MKAHTVILDEGRFDEVWRLVIYEAANRLPRMEPRQKELYHLDSADLLIFSSIALMVAGQVDPREERFLRNSGHAIIIRLALPPAAVVLIDVETSSSSQSL